MLDKIEVRPSAETGRWYWRIVSPGGKILSKGGGFDDPGQAVAQARWIERESICKYLFEITEEPAGIKQIFDPQRFPSLRKKASG